MNVMTPTLAMSSSRRRQESASSCLWASVSSGGGCGTDWLLWDSSTEASEGLCEGRRPEGGCGPPPGTSSCTATPPPPSPVGCSVDVEAPIATTCLPLASHTTHGYGHGRRRHGACVPAPLSAIDSAHPPFVLCRRIIIIGGHLRPLDFLSHAETSFVKPAHQLIHEKDASLPTRASVNFLLLVISGAITFFHEISYNDWKFETHSILRVLCSYCTRL